MYSPSRATLVLLAGRRSCTTSQSTGELRLHAAAPVRWASGPSTLSGRCALRWWCSPWGPSRRLAVGAPPLAAPSREPSARHRGRTRSHARSSAPSRPRSRAGPVTGGPRKRRAARKLARPRQAGIAERAGPPGWNRANARNRILIHFQNPEIVKICFKLPKCIENSFLVQKSWNKLCYPYKFMLHPRKI
jgi:hypothetical protein